MEIITGIRERRSIRNYTSQEITKEDIEKIVEISRFAPSWANTQTPRYTLVLNREMKDRIAAEATDARNTVIINGAPAVVVLSTVDKRAGYDMDGNAKTSKGEHWQSFDAGIATEVFCLAAHAYGLGTLIIGMFDEQKVVDIIGLPEGEKVSVLILVGYSAESPEAPKRKETSKLFRVIE